MASPPGVFHAPIIGLFLESCYIFKYAETIKFYLFRCWRVSLNMSSVMMDYNKGMMLICCFVMETM